MSFKEQVKSIRQGAVQARDEDKIKISSSVYVERYVNYTKFLSHLVSDEFQQSLLERVKQSCNPYNFSIEDPLTIELRDFPRSIFKIKSVESVRADLDAVLAYLDVRYELEEHQDKNVEMAVALSKDIFLFTEARFVGL